MKRSNRISDNNSDTNHLNPVYRLWLLKPFGQYSCCTSYFSSGQMVTGDSQGKLALHLAGQLLFRQSRQMQSVQVFSQESNKSAGLLNMALPYPSPSTSAVLKCVGILPMGIFRRSQIQHLRCVTTLKMLFRGYCVGLGYPQRSVSSWFRRVVRLLPAIYPYVILATYCLISGKATVRVSPVTCFLPFNFLSG